MWISMLTPPSEKVKRRSSRNAGSPIIWRRLLTIDMSPLRRLAQMVQNPRPRSGVALCALGLCLAGCSKSEGPVDDAAAGHAGSSSATAGTVGTAGAALTSNGGASAGSGSASAGSNNASAGTGVGGIASSSGGVTSSSGGAAAGGSGGSAGAISDTVTRKASSFKFRHFAIETNSGGVWSGAETPSGQPIETAYDTVVLENGYLRVTILPSYGGRILSIVHKPTNRELLYQNPLGTPYLMKQGIFYYDYLVIMGGIFPSFPEPEHGKYWNQPYDFEVVSESAEAVTVRMSRKDDRDLATGVPAKYDVGRTDVLVQLEVTLRAGSAALELNTKLTNTRSTAVPNFEYWTVTTLAPGSTPGQTAIPLETRIMAKMDKVHLLESSWSWFGSAEQRVSGEVFEWKNLSSFKNWVDQGTAFANPQYNVNWSGLSNEANRTSILRVSDNVETPGLKLWTFGKDSLNVDINVATQWLRPTIEMWHGVTPEFWKRRSLAASEVRTWTDRYFATQGLGPITAASEHGAMSLTTTVTNTDDTFNVAATLVRPNQTLKAILRLNGKVVSEQAVVSAAADVTKLSTTVPTSMLSAPTVFEAEFLQGDKSLLKGQLTVP